MVKTLIVIAAAAIGTCLLLLGIAAATGGLGLFNGTTALLDFSSDKPIASSANSKAWAWSGDDFKNDVPANVHYEPGAKGPARIVIHGPSAELDKIGFSHGKLAFTQRGVHPGFNRIDVSLRGAIVRKFSFAGDTHLTLGSVNQDRLDVNVAGAATIDAAAPGRVDTLTLNIAGHSEDHLGKLAVGTAHIHIAGHGDITIAPTDTANIDIMGRGDIKLMTKPKKLSTHVMGSGRVTDAAGHVVQSNFGIGAN
jgi:hypothetical protein